MAKNNVRLLQGLRRAQRYPTRIVGRVTADRRAIAIEIADISRIGACVRGPDLPQRGIEVVLAALDLEVVATVVWNDGRACGLNFHTTIEPLAVVRRYRHVPSLDTLTPALAMRA